MDPHNHNGIPDDPARFEEAIAALRDRVPMTSELFDELEANEREFAFTVANVSQASVVADVYDAIERAVSKGTDFEVFRDDVGASLEESWGGEQPGRLETIFRTNVMASYNAGRFRLMTSPTVKAARPYVRWDVIDDSRTSDEICRPILKAKVILPLDHPWTRTHWPPLHPNCRTVPTPLTEDEARAEGITSSPPSVHVVDGFGAAPSVSGGDWEPEPEDYPEPMVGALEDKLAEGGG